MTDWTTWLIAGSGIIVSLTPLYVSQLRAAAWQKGVDEKLKSVKDDTDVLFKRQTDQDRTHRERIDGLLTSHARLAELAGRAIGRTEGGD